MKKKIGIALLCLSCFGAGIGVEWLYVRHTLKARTRDRTAKNEAAVKSFQEKEAAKRWDPLPPPPLPAYGAALAVPSLPPIEPGYFQTMNGVLAPDTELDLRLRERFLQLVDSNPDPEMADLAAKVRSEELHVLFGPMPPMTLAVFRLWPIDGDLAGSGRPFDQYRPEIVVNLGFVASINQPDGLRFFEVVLNHEYLHYLQYLETSDETLRRTFVAALPGQVRDERTCAFFWENELDAYRHSNEKAVRWGVRDDLSSRIGDSRAFNQYVFMTAGQGAAMNSPECLHVWAKLAGHPHPEAFKP